MAAFSSRGPVNVGRIKPDVVAPGTNILSVRTHQYSAAMDGESGLGDWILPIPWALTTATAHSGTHSLSTAKYGANLNASLTSPVIDIRTEADTISFYTTYNFGAGESGTVEYWNGTIWVTCDSLSGSQAAWIYRSCSLPVSNWNNTQKQNFQFRFRLQSDDNPTGNGWSVDDILVTPRGWGFDTSTGSPDLNYFYMGGTSMATPLVAGGTALIREYYVDRGHTPSAALVKSTLINGAIDPTPGQYGTGPTQEIGARPNSASGWGRVNIQASLFPTTPTNFLYNDVTKVNGLKTKDAMIFRFQVRDASVPFRATLVWSDYPTLPETEAGKLNNDLDIEVLTPGNTTLYPNGLTARDDKNNVEDVFIPSANMKTGIYTVTVRGFNIPTGPQGFGLVVRGGNISRAVNIAVNPAQYDDIGAILTSMGYGWTQISDATLNTYANISKYDIIYANCSSAALNNGAAAASSLQEFVQKGGSLYASDFAYSYVTNAFPSFVTFFSDNPHIGSTGTVTGQITDPGLASYLNPNSPPSTISLNYNLGGWVPINSVSTQTTVHIRGDVPTSQGTLFNKPLVVSFSPYANSTGRVIYTTFHNEAQQTDIEKKLLEYLVLVPVTSRISEEAQEVVRDNGVTVKQVNLSTINQGVSSPQIPYDLASPSKLVFVLNWSGSTLRLTLTRPDGSPYTQIESSTPPLTVVIPDAEAGQWKYQVTGVNVPSDNYPYVVAIGDNCPIGEKIFLPLILKPIPSLNLTVAKAGTGSGTVTSNPAGINCGGTCTYTFPYNTLVTLTAAPIPSSTFGGWDGAGCSGTGTCSVTMSAAQSVTATFNTVSSQIISVSAHAPASAAYNSSFTVAATASSGLPVTYSASGVCTNVGATFTMTSGIGVCSVHYNQTGNASYAPAPEVIEAVGATLLSQAITVSTHAPASAAYNSSFTVAATASSGLPVSYSVFGVCTNIGGTITMTSGTGLCFVHYNQAGNLNYAAALEVTETVSAARVQQTITITTHAPASATYLSSFTVVATASSGLPVIYSASGACANVLGSFTMISASGTCIVHYNQVGDINYLPAPEVTETVSTTALAQTRTVTTPPGSAAYLSSFSVESTAGRELPFFIWRQQGLLQHFDFLQK